ncbi:hypothetical protein BU26DRAFT_521778 [Trematosphaeria pertusa]|uniref:Uncharacterized protein n=1 Tax=Trematosphaeria pertusa TaxID=390896 RepID=A0A6A6I6X8_9PLEO|nr:uncharacterized protein BU26DRAFT_521778 [Trematosphaeria pertusa]KAF2245270.1 hypothetical protein BU26DRAFT_521778 [Trematosphaeria pertusa]
MHTKMQLLLAVAMSLTLTQGHPMNMSTICHNGTNSTGPYIPSRPPLQMAQLSESYPRTQAEHKFSNTVEANAYTGLLAVFIAIAVLFPLIFCGGLWFDRRRARKPVVVDDVRTDYSASTDRPSFPLRVFRRMRHGDGTKPNLPYDPKTDSFVVDAPEETDVEEHR